jgi:hypothetical protein
MRLDEEAWNRWAAAIEQVKVDLQSTINDRAVYQGFNEVVRENEDWIRQHQGLLFYDFVVRSYVARVALGVRRQVRVKDDAISLVRIMSQMRDCAAQLTLDFYLERFPRNPDYDVPWQEWTFKQISEDGRVASTTIIDAHIGELKRLTTEIEAFADKTLAHRDKKGYSGKVTFNDLDAAVDALDDIACKYISVLTGKGYSSLQATIVFDWKRIFRVPWREPAP